MQTLTVHVTTADALTDAERGAWRQMVSANPYLKSPYFSLGYLDAISQARPDIRVVCVRKGERLAGFVALQKGPVGHARPHGGVVNDCFGLISAPGEDIALGHVLARAGVRAFDFKYALSAQAPFRTHAECLEGGWVIDLRQGFDAYLQSRKKLGGGTFGSIKNAPKRLSREGQISVCFDDRRPETLEALYAWKSRQYQTSGFPDLFALKWPRDLLEALWEKDRAEGAGLMSSMELDGQLIAVHFGLINPDVLHLWFPAYNPDFLHLTPGNALMIEMIRLASEHGFHELHMGPGDGRQKKTLACFQEGLATGCITQPGVMGWARQMAGVIEKTADPLPLGPFARAPGKAFRKIDRIAALYGV